MSQYDDTNRGAIWPNDRMRPDKQDPHFTGSLDVNGVEYWVSAWKKRPDAKPGAPVVSFTIKPKEDRRNEYTEQSPPPPRDYFDDL